MNIIVFSPYVRISSPHYETELEIMEKHRSDGDDVTHLVCNGEMLTCDFNPKHDYIECARCIGKRNFGRSLIDKKIKTIPFMKLTRRDKNEIKTLNTTFSDINELKGIYIDNFDIGYAVASSTISYIRDPVPDFKDHSEFIAKLFKSSLMVYRSIQNHFSSVKPDIVYIYNGRFALSRAAVRACESQGIDYYVHDRGHSNQYYAMYKNTLMQDFKNKALRIMKTWEEAKEDSERFKIGEKYFLNNYWGVETRWYSHVKTQKEGLLPQDWNKEKRNVAIFPNSEDEFAAISEQFENSVYASQLEGIKKIAESMLERCPNHHLYVRMHPHYKDVNNINVRKMLLLKSPNLTIIPPDSFVNSYTLVKNADTVLTFGSTVGMEAIFWGKPSVLAAPFYYQVFGGTYNASTHEEVINFLSTNLKPKDKEVALMYGYYMSIFGKVFGAKFKHYKAESFIKGKFKGQYVVSKPSNFHKLYRFGLRCMRKSRILFPYLKNYFSINGTTGVLKLTSAVLITTIPRLYAEGIRKGKKYCPVCNWQGRQFLPNIQSNKVVFHDKCPSCHSDSNQRALKLCFDKVMRSNEREGKIFCTFYENQLLSYLSSICQSGVTSLDYGKNDRNPKYLINLMNTPFQNSEFDMILCDNSLLKVKDEHKAFLELHRILKSNGILILSLSNKEDYPETNSAGKSYFLNDKQSDAHENDFGLRIPNVFYKEIITFKKDRESFDFGISDVNLWLCKKL